MGQERTERISFIISKRKPLSENIKTIRASIAQTAASFERMTPVCSAALSDDSIAQDFAGMQEVLDSCARNISELQGLRNSLAHL